MKQDVGFAGQVGYVARKGDRVIVRAANNQPESACSNSVFVAKPERPDYSILVEKDMVEING
jgi:hypothetical protein